MYKNRYCLECGKRVRFKHGHPTLTYAIAVCRDCITRRSERYKPLNQRLNAERYVQFYYRHREKERLRKNLEYYKQKKREKLEKLQALEDDENQEKLKNALAYYEEKIKERENQLKEIANR